jgi:hypothetical protein
MPSERALSWPGPGGSPGWRVTVRLPRGVLPLRTEQPPIDRVAADRPLYSGKHKKHGMNLQVIASPAGGILWVWRAGQLAKAIHVLQVREA